MSKIFKSIMQLIRLLKVLVSMEMFTNESYSILIDLREFLLLLHLMGYTTTFLTLPYTVVDLDILFLPHVPQPFMG